jgi:ATP-binding cassette subfamily B protein
VSSHSSATLDAWQSLPHRLRTEVETQLGPGESTLAWFEPDLNAGLHFAQGLVVLTNRRLLSVEADGCLSESDSDGAGSARCQTWPLQDSCSLRAVDQGGAGALELLGPGGRLAQWRFTTARAVSARRLADRFKAIGAGDSEEEEEPPADSICPTCGGYVSAEQARCPACAAAEAAVRPTRTLLRLVRFARARGGMALLGVLLTVASTAAAMVPPYLTMPIIDNVLIPYGKGAHVDFGLIPWYLTAFAVASLLTWALSWARTYVLAWVSERISADLRNQTYTHLQRLSLEYFGGKRTGDLISRISTDTDRICYFLSVNLLDFASDILMIFMTAIVLLSIDFQLALATLVPLPLIAWMVQRVRTRLRGGFQTGSRAWAEMTSVLADTIPGIRVVKAFAQEQREVERFRRANDRVLAANDRVNQLWSFFSPVVVVLTDAGLLVIWIFGVWQVYRYRLTVGALQLFFIYIARFYTRLDSMSRMVSATQRTAAGAQRVFNILDRKATVAEPLNPVPLEHPRGEFEFRNVGFRYGSRSVLEAVDLLIRPGEMIGLVGPSGAGKTTVVNLACRFFDVAEGAILLDGTDIRSFRIEEFRRNIGLVLQEPFLFYGSIAENIAYGRPDAGREEIVAAARAARAHEFILRLPDAYDSLVGERGQFLSGGERQRISIARALLIDPKILILDEATSSVDTETEREIQLALENLVRGRTTIAIAHRLSTLRRADRLVVIERGRISAVGPHADLLEKSPTYARLYHAQLEVAGGKPA